jgi:protein SCO1/2
VRLSAREACALGALAAIAAISAAWWALALWPAGDVPPEWLVRTRAVCFGTRPDGLPGPEGWGALITQPIGMLAILMIGWREEVVGALGTLAARPLGRLALVVTLALGIVGAGAIGMRVRVAAAASANAESLTELPVPGEDDLAVGYRNEDRPAPALGLVGQDGRTVTLDGYSGSPLLVSFVFGHCETICPIVVRETLGARRQLEAEGREVAAIVITLDPWRDTPGRLPYLASRLDLRDGESLLGGEVADVEAALDRWEVPRQRDLRTGDIVHPPLVYVVDANGRIAYSAAGGEQLIADLVRRMPTGS